MIRSAPLRRYTKLRPQRLTPRRGKVEAPEYLAWLRRGRCLVAGRDCWGRIDPHHVGHCGQARRNDWNALPLCRFHHEMVQHGIGRPAFEARFAVEFDSEIARLNREFKEKPMATAGAAVDAAKSRIVHFEPNVPQEVALRFPDGKRVMGRFGPQILFTLEQPFNGQIYVPENVAQKISELGVNPGERMLICKATADGKRIEWRVERAPNPPNAHGELAVPRIPPQASGETKRPVSETKPAAREMIPAQAESNGVPYWNAKTELARCYGEAIEVLVSARDRAAQSGLPVQFTGEDLRQVAAVLYIDAGKNRRCPGLRA